MTLMMCDERSMEVIPLYAMPLYCDRMKEEGTPVTYHMSKMSDTPSPGAMRLSELAEELSSAARAARTTTTMTFDERIRDMGIPLANYKGGIDKVLELLNTTLYQIVLDDAEADKAARRDYSRFLVEYVDIVRDSRGAASSREHALLLSRAFRAIQIAPRDVDGGGATIGDILATLNANLHGKIAHDIEGGVVARDYSPFFVRYVQIASDAEETSSGDVPRARELLVRAYKASNVPIGEE